MSEAPTTGETDQQPDPADDPVRGQALEVFREVLGDALVGHHLVPGRDLWVRVTRDAWVDAGRVARDRLECRYFGFLSAIDWLPSPWGRYEDAAVDLDHVPTPAEAVEQGRGAIETGVAGGDTRFQVFARVQSPEHAFGVTLKCDVPDDDLRMPTWVPVYPGANWHERETWEMYGIVFEGHPNLRHLYLPSDFEGHPLRKDFPLLARVVKPWPGIVDVEPMPETPEGGDDAGAAPEEGR